MARLGADVDELERLAARFESAASTLDGAAGKIDASIRSMWWEGPNAGAFTIGWRRRDRVALTSSATALRRAASTLRTNAHQQRQTSGSGVNLANLAAGLFQRVRSGFAGFLRQATERRQWYEDAGQGQLALHRYATPADHLAWWNQLTPQQRWALMELAPGELAFMAGLPTEVRDQARQVYLEFIDSTLAINETETTIGAELGVEIVTPIGLAISAEIGAEAGVTTTNYADGSSVVTLELSAEDAAGLGIPELAKVTTGFGGRVSVSYRFDSPEEAEAFKRELYGAITPDGTDLVEFGVKSLLPFGAPLAAADIAGDKLRAFGSVLSRNSSRRESFEVEASMANAAELKVPTAKISAKEQMGLIHDFETGQSRVYLDLSGEAEFRSLVGAGYQQDASLRGEVITQDGAITGFKISSEVNQATGLMLASLDGGNSVTAFGGPGVGFEASVDLTDPVNRVAVESFLVGNGATLRDVLNRAEVRAHVDAETLLDGRVGVDAKAVSVSAGGTTSTTTRLATWVKPPGGSFIELPGGMVPVRGAK